MIVSKIIKERGYTIEEVANKIGIARPTLAKTIGNNPTVNTLRKIAEAIGCDVTDFFADEVATPNNSCDLIALVKFQDRVFEAFTTDELQEIVNLIRKSEDI